MFNPHMQRYRAEGSAQLDRICSTFGKDLPTTGGRHQNGRDRHPGITQLGQRLNARFDSAEIIAIHHEQAKRAWTRGNLRHRQRSPLLGPVAPERHVPQLQAARVGWLVQRPGPLDRLRQVALRGDNLFAELLHTVRVCTLGQITDALFAVGGQYRRSM